jgi:CRP-like cAMP-binding protein
MESNELISFLSEVQLFNGLEKSELSKIADMSELVNFKSGEYLFKENQLRLSLFIIYNGRVELVKSNSFGKEKLFRIFESGDFLSEGALMDDNPHSTSGKVVEDSQVLVVKREKFHKLFEEDFTVALRILASVSRLI